MTVTRQELLDIIAQAAASDKQRING